MTSSEEDRLLKQFDPACIKYAKKYRIPDTDIEDRKQECRIAALKAIRQFDPRKGRGKLSTYVIQAITLRMRSLAYQWRNPRCGNKLRQKGQASLDDPLYEDQIRGDAVASSSSTDANLFYIACHSLCERDVERDIIDALSRGSITLRQLGKLHNVSHQRIHQIRLQLLQRIRKELQP